MIGKDGQGLHYLLGLPRSGTTLLSVLLTRHPAAAAPPEPWLMLALEALGEVGLRHPAESYLLGEGFADFTRGLDLPRAAAAAARSLYNQRLAAEGRAVLIDKTPRYWRIADFLADAFPAAGFLWLVRNPLAVAASLKKTWGYDPLGSLDAGQNEFLSFDLFLGPRRLKDFAERRPEKVRRVDYEALVGDENGVMAGVFAAMGLDPAAATAAFDPARARPATAAMGDRKILETKGVHAQALDSWKTDLTPAEMQAVFDGLGRSLLEELGYGGAVQALFDLGVVDRGAETTAAKLAELERRLARRTRDGAHASRLDPINGWPMTLRQAADLAYADPVRVIQTDYRLNELHESLVAHKEMIARLDREHAARIEDHRHLVQERDRSIAALRATLGEHQDIVRGMDESHRRSIREHQDMIRGMDESHRRSIREHQDMIRGMDESHRRSIREHQELIWGLEAQVARLQAANDTLRRWAEDVQASRSGRLLAALGRLHPPPAPDENAMRPAPSAPPSPRSAP